MHDAELKVEYIPVGDLKQYSGNAKRHPKKQVAEIRESIEQFGFNDPIAIWRNNEIIEGHGRLLAALEMGMDKVPVIRLDSLTDEERRAYVLAHNQTTLSSGWDEKKLRAEIQNLPTIDMAALGFDSPTLIEPDLPDFNRFYGDERLRTDRAYHLEKLDVTELTNGFWQMPVINNDGYVPKDFISFNYAISNEEKNCGVHFYIDDYQFERVWNYPDKYLSVLSQYEAIISPDFSIYVDMPMPMKIWNTYRSRWIGAYYQRKGIKVIPNINYAFEDTWSFAFEGIPKGSIIAKSTLSLKKDDGLRQMFVKGMEECIRRIEPSKILLYGGNIEFDAHGIEIIHIENKAAKRLKGA